MLTALLGTQVGLSPLLILSINSVLSLVHAPRVLFDMLSTRASSSLAQLARPACGSLFGEDSSSSPLMVLLFRGSRMLG